jgi:hypothetical protein
MNRPLFSILYLFVLCSCGTFKYYQPNANPALFKNSGEVHASGGLNSSGASLQSAVSVTENVAVMANYNSTLANHNVKEGEVAVGFYDGKASTAIFISGGLGFGKNHEFTDDSKNRKSFEGKFTRPFVQLNGGITGGTIFGKLQGDLIGILKASYLQYEGFRNEDPTQRIISNYLTMEPTLVFAVGSPKFKFNFTFGFPTRPSFKKLSETYNARTYPATIGFGVNFIFGRNAD